MSTDGVLNAISANLTYFDITLDSSAFFEFVSYNIVIPIIGLIGLSTNLISIVTFSHSSLKGDLYKYLLCHSIFSFLEFFFGIIYSMETLLNNWKLQSTIESARYELYFRHFACNFCSMMSMFCKMASLFERYADLKQNKFTRCLNKVPVSVLLIVMMLLSVTFFLPILFTFKIDVLKNVEDFFQNKILLLNLKQERKYFLRKNSSHDTFFDFFKNNTIYGVTKDESGIFAREKLCIIILIVNALIDLGSVAIIATLICLLLFGMQKRAEIKRNFFFASISNSAKIDYELKRLNLFNKNTKGVRDQKRDDKIIDAFDESKKSNELIYDKSAYDINKEYLICLVISINFLLAFNRMPDLIYLLVKNLTTFLNAKNLVYFCVIFDGIRHFTNSIDLFFYLLFDKSFRKSYEIIFKRFCYFKLHLPKKRKNNFLYSFKFDIR
jgi:hypothetical protein